MRSIESLIAEGQLPTLAEFLGVSSRGFSRETLRFLENDLRFRRALANIRAAAREAIAEREGRTERGR